MTLSAPSVFRTLTCGLLIAAAAGQGAWGQSLQPAIFVANDGNLEGSVTSFRVNSNGSLTFVQKVITPGSTNPQCIDISPNGRWLCAGHGTANGVTEQLTFLEVNSDATMTLRLETTTPDSPIDLVWLDDTHIAVTNTSANPDQLIVYQFNPTVPSISQVWFSSLGTQCFYIAIDRAHHLLFPQSSSSAVWPMTWNASGVLTKLIPAEQPTGVYYLGPGLSPDGTKLYFGGGISSGGQPNSSRWIGGFNVNTASGALTQMPNSPFLSPPQSGTSGPSPKQVVVSSNGQYAYVAHGTSGDVQGFNINAATGELAAIAGSYYDVGSQGQCSRMAVLNNRLYVLRYYSNPTPGDGVLSFQINADGTITQIGSVISTQGSLPWDIVAWPGLELCPADVNGNGTVDVADLLQVITSWGPCPNPKACPGDVDGSGTVNVADLLAVITAWGACPNQ